MKTSSRSAASVSILLVHLQDGILKRLRDETHVLSKSKRRLEQHLLSMKSHLWNLDSLRKTMKSKISILSRVLELDAQRLKVSRL